MFKEMLALLCLWAVASLLGACAGSGAFLESLAGDSSFPPAAGGVVESITGAAGWEGAGYGAAATGIIGLVLSFIRGQFRAKRKTGELWKEIKEIKNGKKPA